MSLVDLYEKLGYFYLGKEIDLNTHKITDNMFLYKSKNLTTHALIVGMTGSGKTGLGIALIEEALMDDIPCLIIDPKGDLGNLALMFDNLSYEEFLPWISEEEAKLKNLSKEEYAKDIAKKWQEGLKSWGIDKERIKKLKEKCDVSIYTPGSDAGINLSLLSDFESPSDDILNDEDMLGFYIDSTVNSLIAFLGGDVSDIEKVFLSNLFYYYWSKKESLNLEKIISNIITPPFDKIGMLPLEKVFPKNKRMKFSSKINNILANPSVRNWIKGEKLNISNLLYTPDGKPRAAVISIAHLNDEKRMFFVTLLLNKYIEWMRRQGGSSQLKTILYMDEIFGYFPTQSNPPSKQPMLLLLKQARAFGTGVVLATQNPIDLDYKGLSNTGNLFIGRLQTKQDKQRLIDGLISNEDVDKKELLNLISSLKTREFLFKSAKSDIPELFTTRWVMSYLKGPLTKEEISKLMADKKKNNIVKPVNVKKSNKKYCGELDVKYFFTPSDELELSPYLVYEAKIKFYNETKNIDLEKEIKQKIYVGEYMKEFDLNEAEEFNIQKCTDNEPENAIFEEVNSDFESMSKKEIIREIKNYLYHNYRITLYRSRKLKMISSPQENLGEFKSKIKDKLDELFESELEKLKNKYEKKQDVLQVKIKKAKQKLEKEKEDVKAKTTSTIIDVGLGILSAFFGRKSSSVTKVASSIKKAGGVMKEKKDVTNAEENLEFLQNELNKLEKELEKDILKLKEKYSIENYIIEEIKIKPKKSDIYNIETSLCYIQE